ncbi:hypothetical protein [Pseudalkalibacillus berkeleyi]|uniref:Uncharacterized protein n=1 Tax=Pseudalkalibacillus berkeleyi TaxID=1069813 RepID=A0ABS9H1E2_9BACL|nr:hypothetical protein [Pseudalkalibacillus berkeleyi]MCF6138814.1 hypothetical protein [Pseudalkalibacillus berkeleyi]
MYDHNGRNYSTVTGSTFRMKGTIGAIGSKVAGGKKITVPTINDVEASYALVRWGKKEERIDLKLKNSRK